MQEMVLEGIVTVMAINYANIVTHIFNQKLHKTFLWACLDVLIKAFFLIISRL